MKYLLLKDARAGRPGVGLFLDRHPELGARKQPDERHEQREERGEGERGCAAAPAGEHELGPRYDGKSPGEERPFRRVLVRHNRLETCGELDHRRDDLENRVGGDQQHRERESERGFPEQRRGHKAHGQYQRNLRQGRRESAEVDVTLKTAAQHAAGEPEREARQDERRVLPDRDAEVERAHRQKQREARSREEVLLQAMPEHGGGGSRHSLSAASIASALARRTFAAISDFALSAAIRAASMSEAAASARRSATRGT